MRWHMRTGHGLSKKLSIHMQSMLCTGMEATRFLAGIRGLPFPLSIISVQICNFPDSAYSCQERSKAWSIAEGQFPPSMRGDSINLGQRIGLDTGR